MPLLPFPLLILFLVSIHTLTLGVRLSWQPSVQSNRFGFWNSEGGIEFVFYYLGKCSHCSGEEVGNSAGCFKKTWCWMVL